MSVDKKKGVFFEAFPLEKGYFLGLQSVFFFVKRGLFSFVNISERGTFSIWRTIIRPPFCM